MTNQAEIEFPPTALADWSNVSDAIDRFGDKVRADHFFKVKGKKLLGMAGIEGREVAEWNRLCAALTILQDQQTIHFAVAWKGNAIESVYLRTWSDLHANICTPLFPPDVEALCAMVQDGSHGLSRLLGVPVSKVQGFLKSGCNNGVIDRLRAEVLSRHLRVGTLLDDDPLRVDTFMTEAVARREARLARVEQIQAEAPTTDECPKCKEAEKPIVDLVCASCAELLKSGFGEVEPEPEPKGPPPFEPRASASPLAQQVARLIYEAGVDLKADYNRAGEQADRIEKIMVGNDMTLTDAGIYIDGYNWTEPMPEPVPVREPERAQKVDGRTRGDDVVVAGMRFSVHKVKSRLDSALSTLMDIQTTKIPGLLAVGDESLDAEGKKLVRRLVGDLARVFADLNDLDAELVESDTAERLQDSRG